jgi:hypothetical protein
MEEEWRVIEGFPDYQVSNLGRIKSLDYRRSGIEQIMKLNRVGDYLGTSLWRDKKEHKKYLHRLMAIAFLPNPDNLPDVDHINRNKHDNRLENLRWYSKRNNGLNTDDRPRITKYGAYIGFNQKEQKYRFQRQRENNRICRRFDTLEEAIAFRDAYLIQNPIQASP